MKNKVLIIAAHPDDDILGCGGFMSRYRGVYKIKVLFVAEGSTCRFNEPNSDKARKEVLERNKMGINALNSLSVNDIIIEVQKTSVKNSSDLKRKVEGIFKKGEKTLLLTIINKDNRRRYLGVKIN